MCYFMKFVAHDISHLTLLRVALVFKYQLLFKAVLHHDKTLILTAFFATHYAWPKGHF